ncbi:MAG: aldo/keto reductase [Eubacteriaceae bacterium]
MNYRENHKKNDKLSILGYGCMRFTKRGGVIDQQKAESELLYAVNAGVNYFDTAYIYPGSESALGKFLSKGYRDRVNIATKLPHYLIKSYDDIEKYFQIQLSRLQTDYIDYYLMHMLPDITKWEKLKKLGIERWIEDKKKARQIRNIGFSFHGGTNSFVELVDAYDWDFCQIQFNYMDEHSQAGLRGLKYAYEKNLAVIIMEPLKGGRLANNLPKGAQKLFLSAEPKRSPAEWGLRWVMNHPEVAVVLSGMNDIKQIKENIELASDILPNSMSAKELDLINKVKKVINEKTKVPCTGCGYCMPCPNGVDIPVCFKSYNDIYSDSWFTGFKEYIMCTTLRAEPSNASKCVKCGKCERLCPQGIKIIDELQNVKKKLETPIYKIAKKATRKRF